MKKTEKEDILFMVIQELEKFRYMRDRAIQSDSQHMANYACGAIMAMNTFDERIRQYLANK